MLSTLSESGRKVLRGRPGWIRKVNADVQRMGARVVAQYAVLGPYMQTGDYQPAKSVIRVSPFEGHTSYAPYTCTQCDEGWCMTACPVGAITISAVGAKDVLDDRCVGCKLCTIACPYGTMFYDP